MRDPEDPLFRACDGILGWLDELAVPNDQPLTQLIQATVLRSRETFEAITQLIGHELDTQAGMLCRPLFEDMVIAHWCDYNRHDPDWLVQRYFNKRDAMALVQEGLSEEHSWAVGPPLTDTAPLRPRKNELLKGNQARRDWWDPGEQGRGRGEPIGLHGIVEILEAAADRHERYHPRFAGGEEALLKSWDVVLRTWYSQMLHHTAVGLPFQPTAAGPVATPTDNAAAFRVLFGAYWMFGQQIYLLHEDDHDAHLAFTTDFFTGLNAFGAVTGMPPLELP